MTGPSGATEPPGAVQLLPLTGLPEIGPGSDLAGRLLAAAERWGGLADGDLLVVSSKVVSKALGLRARPADGPDRPARERAVAEHTVRVVAERRTPHGTTRVVEAVAGPVMAAAGVDGSNTGPEGGLLLLPVDPDGAARDLHAAIAARLPGRRFGLLLSDTAGRPWRSGQTDLALGSHGVRVADDLRGGTDADGRPLTVTTRALADEIAAAADLVKGKQQAVPAALVRGLPDAVGPGPGARSLVRTGPGDWFALGHREAVRAALGAPPGSAAADVVGLPSVAPEPATERGARAVRLALLGHPGVQVTDAPGSGSGAGYEVSSPDPVVAGRVAARLEVALAGEDLAGVPVAVRRTGRP